MKNGHFLIVRRVTLASYDVSGTSGESVICRVQVIFSATHSNLFLLQGNNRLSTVDSSLLEEITRILYK